MRKKTQDDIEDDFMDAEEIPVPPPPVKATAEAEKEPLEHSGYRKKIFHNTLDEMKKAYLQIKEAEEKEKQEEKRKHKEEKRLLKEEAKVHS